MYDREAEKAKVLKLMRQSSQEEIAFTKQENFVRAIDFALDEVDEIEKHFQQFVTSVEHLEVFQEMVKEPLSHDMNKMVENLRYLIEKNYTKEDKEKMPENVLTQVRATQEKRFNLLKQVARRYFYQSQKKQQ